MDSHSNMLRKSPSWFCRIVLKLLGLQIFWVSGSQCGPKQIWNEHAQMWNERNANLLGCIFYLKLNSYLWWCWQEIDPPNSVLKLASIRGRLRTTVLSNDIYCGVVLSSSSFSKNFLNNVLVLFKIFYLTCSDISMWAEFAIA